MVFFLVASRNSTFCSSKLMAGLLEGLCIFKKRGMGHDVSNLGVCFNCVKMSHEAKSKVKKDKSGAAKKEAPKELGGNQLGLDSAMSFCLALCRETVKKRSSDLKISWIHECRPIQLLHPSCLHCEKAQVLPRNTTE